jgi:hypothetical protein
MVNIYVYPEVLTVRKATIVLMVPFGNARAGNVLWVFSETVVPVTLIGNAVATSSFLFDATFVVNSLCEVFGNGKSIEIGHAMYSHVHTSLIKLHMAGELRIRRDKWNLGSMHTSKPEEKSQTLLVLSKIPEDFAPAERTERELAPSAPTGQKTALGDLETVPQAQMQDLKEPMKAIKAKIAMLKNNTAQMDPDGDKFPAISPSEVNEWDSEDEDPNSGSNEDLEAGLQEDTLNSISITHSISKAGKILAPLPTEIQQIQDGYRLYEEAKGLKLKSRALKRQNMKPDVSYLLRLDGQNRELYLTEKLRNFPNWAQAEQQSREEIREWRALLQQGQATPFLLAQEARTTKVLKRCKPSMTYEEALDDEREADRKAVQDNEDRVVEIDDVDMVEILSAAPPLGLYKGQ